MMTKFVQPDDLVHLVARVLTRHGMSDENASIIARTCVVAERDGVVGHGLFRIADYVSTLESGWVDGKATPMLEKNVGASVVRVDARNGLAQPALERAKQIAIEKARATGTCIVAIRNSHHLAALWPDVEMFAREGLVAVAFVNSICRVVPWGGRTPVYGTNPMAFAVPRQSGEPLVFDQASSAMAYGEVRVAAQCGHELPEGIGVDRNGRSTTNAQAIVDGGSLLRFGGHKGSSIAMMIEILRLPSPAAASHSKLIYPITQARRRRGPANSFSSSTRSAPERRTSPAGSRIS
jgi:delta1-piperideine-2-carboxylate reductase